MGADEAASWSFEQLLAKLEEFTATLARGEVGIEEAVSIYERAEALHALAAARLEAARGRLAELSGSGDATALAQDPSEPWEPF